MYLMVYVDEMYVYIQRKNLAAKRLWTQFPIKL